MDPRPVGLPEGIVSVLQTPFEPGGGVDLHSLTRLVRHAVDGGAGGVLAPVVASEVDYLSHGERVQIVTTVASATAEQIPFVVGASGSSVEQCREFGRLAQEVGAAAYLAAVPPAHSGEGQSVVRFFRDLATENPLPLIVQDLAWNGPGLSIETIVELRKRVPKLAGLKVETVPAGPKYTLIKQRLGEDFYVCGGWAVPQMIEALDRGVDGMVPESSMVRVYREIFDLHRSGKRARALGLFRQLLPVLTFSNQEIVTSIAFFKRLLVRQGVFEGEYLRQPGFAWDRYNSRIADELIDLYLSLERSLPPLGGGSPEAGASESRPNT